jgi:hypothetical protein
MPERTLKANLPNIKKVKNQNKKSEIAYLKIVLLWVNVKDLELGM